MRTIRENNLTSTLVFSDVAGAHCKPVGRWVTDNVGSAEGRSNPRELTYLGKRPTEADGESAEAMGPYWPTQTLRTDNLDRLHGGQKLDHQHGERAPSQVCDRKDDRNPAAKNDQQGYTTNVSSVKAHIGIRGNPMITTEGTKALTPKSSRRHRLRASHGNNHTA